MSELVNIPSISIGIYLILILIVGSLSTSTRVHTPSISTGVFKIIVRLCFVYIHQSINIHKSLQKKIRFIKHTLWTIYTSVLFILTSWEAQLRHCREPGVTASRICRVAARQLKWGSEFSSALADACGQSHWQERSAAVVLLLLLLPSLLILLLLLLLAASSWKRVTRMSLAITGTSYLYPI